MNPLLAWEILELALTLVQGQATGKVRTDAEIADTLLQIIQKGMAAYQSHTGQPLDPSLIKPEAPIP